MEFEIESKRGAELGPNSIHTNITMDTIISKIFQKKKKQRFKWTNPMDTTLYFIFIHNENEYLQNTIQSFQHLHSNLNLSDNQIL